MQIRKLVATGVAGLATITLAGCGSDSGSGSANTVPADAGLVVYAGPGIKFDKSEYTATAGKVKVAYDNRDAQRHTLDIVDADKTVLPGELIVGKSGDIDVGDFDLAAGTYSLVCLIPGHENMRAKLVVGG